MLAMHNSGASEAWGSWQRAARSRQVVLRRCGRVQKGLRWCYRPLQVQQLPVRHQHGLLANPSHSANSASCQRAVWSARYTAATSVLHCSVAAALRGCERSAQALTRLWCVA